MGEQGHCHAAAVDGTGGQEGLDVGRLPPLSFAATPSPKLYTAATQAWRAKPPSRSIGESPTPRLS